MCALEGIRLRWRGDAAAAETQRARCAPRHPREWCCALFPRPALGAVLIATPFCLTTLTPPLVNRPNVPQGAKAAAETRLKPRGPKAAAADHAFIQVRERESERESTQRSAAQHRSAGGACDVCAPQAGGRRAAVPPTG